LTFCAQKEILIFNKKDTTPQSLRRQAQWLNKYPNHKVVDLRGNVNTRMQKLTKATGVELFAAAERINLKPRLY
jgi:hydroxymethylbilane synthase